MAKIGKTERSKLGFGPESSAKDGHWGIVVSGTNGLGVVVGFVIAKLGGEKPSSVYVVFGERLAKNGCLADTKLWCRRQGSDKVELWGLVLDGSNVLGCAVGMAVAGVGEAEPSLAVGAGSKF